MKYKVFLGLIAAVTVSAPVFAKSSSHSLAAIDQGTLQAIATQLKADALASSTTPAAALTSVETAIEEREETTERYAQAKAGFYSRLSGVLASLVAFNLVHINGPSDKAPCLMTNVAILGLWAGYECAPLASLGFEYLMETHQEQAA